MFPFNLFKKKEELPEGDLPEQQEYPNQQSFGMQKDFSGIDKEDLILSKLETINAKLDNVIQRLERIEKLAKE